MLCIFGVLIHPHSRPCRRPGALLRMDAFADLLYPDAPTIPLYVASGSAAAHTQLQRYGAPHVRLAAGHTASPAAAACLVSLRTSASAAAGACAAACTGGGAGPSGRSVDLTAARGGSDCRAAAASGSPARSPTPGETAVAAGKAGSSTRPEEPASEGQAQAAGCQDRGGATACGESRAASPRGADAPEGSPRGARGRVVSAGALREQVLSLRAQVRRAVSQCTGGASASGKCALSLTAALRELCCSATLLTVFQLAVIRARWMIMNWISACSAANRRRP
jgi:hypothetical protein